MINVSSKYHFDSHPFLDRVGLSGYKRGFVRFSVLQGMMKRKGLWGGAHYVRNFFDAGYARTEQVSARLPFLQLILEPTLQCNLSCPLCSRASLPSRYEYMNIEQFRAMADALPDCSSVIIAGLGETLLYKDIVPLLSYLADRNIRVSLATNGTVALDGMRDLLLAENVDKIGVSMDSCDPGVYTSMRGKDYLPVVVDNLGKLARWKKQLKSKTRLEMVSVVTEQNLHEVCDLIVSAHRLDLDEVRLKFSEEWLEAPSFDRNDNSGMPLYKQALQSGILHDAARKARILGIPLTISAEMDEQEYKRLYQHRGYKCESPWYQCTILHNGDVGPCLMVKSLHRKQVFGNIFRESFESIWNGAGFRLLRKQILSGQQPAMCKYCTRTMYRG